MNRAIKLIFVIAAGIGLVKVLNYANVAKHISFSVRGKISSITLSKVYILVYITIRNQVKTSFEITKPTLQLYIGEDKVAESQPDLKKYKIVTGDNPLDAIQFEIDPKDRIFWAALLKAAIHSIQNITQILNPNFKAGINLICKGTTYIDGKLFDFTQNISI